MTGVVIVGGGMAGLSVAYELHRAGVRFTLLEAGSRAGGVVLSEKVEDFTIDGGPDALLVQKPDAIRLCEEVGLGPRLVPTKLPRVAYIQRGGRLHPLPAASVLGIPTAMGPFLSTSLFSWPGKARMAAELFVPARRDEGDESIGAFIGRRFGSEAVDYLAEPLLAGIHAGDVDRLSIQALFPRFSNAEREHGSLLRAFWGSGLRTQDSTLKTQDSNQGAFRSLPDGLSELVDAIVARLPAGSILLNTAVRRITPERDRYRVETEAGGAIEARTLVLAAPAYVAARLVREADAELAGLCDGIPYASTVTVALAFPKRSVQHPLAGSGFVVPRKEGTGILAASWLSSKWPNRAPDDKVLMRTFFGGMRDPGACDRSDADLVAASLKALRPLLGISASPILTRVYRWTNASAQHEVGHIDRMTAIERALARHPNLHVTGSGFRGVGIPDCVADGRSIGRKVADALMAQSGLRA